MTKPADMKNSSEFHAACYIMNNGTGVSSETYKDKEMRCTVGLVDEDKNMIDWMQTFFKLKDGSDFDSEVKDGRLDNFAGRGNKYEFNDDNLNLQINKTASSANLDTAAKTMMPMIRYSRAFDTSDGNDNVFVSGTNYTMYSLIQMDNKEHRGKGKLYVDDPMNPMLSAVRSVAFGITSILALAYSV
jgi:hypothetical protein